MGCNRTVESVGRVVEGGRCTSDGAIKGGSGTTIGAMENRQGVAAGAMDTTRKITFYVAFIS